MKTTKPTQERGRQDIESWANHHPENYYLADVGFQRVLKSMLSPQALDALEPELRRFGAELATVVDGLVRTNNLDRNLPVLDRYTAHGRRQEAIAHHPSYHEVGRYIYGSGVMEAYKDGPNMLGALSRFYLSCFNGESGHNCPLACTAGVIRVLQELGSEELKARYLPGLLNRDYAHHLEGAQFLTEVQGGSDVGQNATEATLDAQGQWRISGEKWFCSNIDADVFLMTARLPAQADNPSANQGTRGLGLFLVPRTLEDGEVNGFYIRRLKDKLGTRSMASGECDFDGALAYHMGPLGEGFKSMMELVINVSRLYNAVGCAGLAWRAFSDAQRYAEHRRAFGQPIINYPLVQETLANVRVQIEAMRAGSFYLVALQDKVDLGQGSDQDAAFLRLAINLNKLVTAKRARWAITEGIEIFGGNGAIETFSILPRLLRDSVVFENWEGTHNTLLAQTLRDMHRYKVHEPFFAHIQALLEQADPSGSSPTLRALHARHAQLKGQLAHVLDAPPEVASLAWRPLAESCCELLYAAVSAWHIQRQQLGPESIEATSLSHLIATFSPPTPMPTPEHLARISTLARAK